MTMTVDSLLGDFSAQVDNRVTTRYGDSAAGAGDWREDPAEFDHFVTSTEHLGLPELYPIQREDVRKLIGDDPKMIFGGPEQQDRSYDLERAFQILIALWGKGSGKDYISSIVCCYLVHVVLCLRDPQRYFGLAPGENIDGVNVAYNADQAKRVFFTKLKARILNQDRVRWRWLEQRFNVMEAGRRRGEWKLGRPTVEINDDHIIFPRGIRIFSRHAQNESYEGLNVLFWVMDEASAFLSQLKRENADKIFATLRSSARTRFKQRWIGFILSYSRHADDFTHTNLEKAKADPELGWLPSGPYKCWEVNLMYAGEKWPELPDGRRVPLSLQSDYRDDPDDAKAKYECDPPMAVDALFRQPELLDQAVISGRTPLIEWEPIVTRRPHVLPDGREVERQFSAVKILKWGKLPRGTRVYFHGDPANANDAFALVIGHGVPATIIRVVPAGEVLDQVQLLARGLQYDDPFEWEEDVVKTVIDAVIVWRPDPRRKQNVDLLNVKDVLLQLCDRKISGYRIGGGSFDHFESEETVQTIQARKVPVENETWSNPHQLAVYKMARRAIYNDLVELPDTPSVTSDNPSSPGAVYELKRVQLIEDRKIDHPEGGSKDIADGVARVISHVSAATAEGGFSFGTAYGTASMYEGKGTHAVSSQPKTDPKRTPSPANKAERQAEELRRAERPLGELTPDHPAGARVVSPEEAEKIRAAAARREAGHSGKFAPPKK